MSSVVVPDSQVGADNPVSPERIAPTRPGGAHHAWLAAGVVSVAVWLIATGTEAEAGWPVRWAPVVALLVATRAVWATSAAADSAGRQSWRWLLAAVAAAAGSRLADAGLESTDGGVRDGVVALLVATFAIAAVVGLLTRPRLRASHHQELRIWLEAAGASVAVAAVTWEYLLPAGLDDGAIARLIGTMPAMLEVAVLGALVVVWLRRSPFRRDQRLLAVGLGLTTLVAADLLSPVDGLAAFSAPLDLAAAAALVLVGFYGRQPLVRRRIAAAPTPWWKKMLPFGLMLSLYAVLFWRATRFETSDVGVLPWAGLVVFLLMVVRQAAGMEENRELVELERDQLITALTHELRVPLTAVSGFAEVLAGGWKYLSEAERAELLGIVRDHSAQLVGIVDDMSLVVRDELAGARLHRVRIDGKQLIAEAIRSVFDLNRGPIPVKAEVEPYLELIADRRRLVEMLISLLKNAQRYGNGSILIVAKRSEDGRVIEVHDDGEGLPPRYEGLIWQRFERGAHHLNDHVPGSGLGLTIVRALAEAHGGSAGYRRSDRLGGACFTIELPYDADLEVVRDQAPATA